MCRQHRQGCRGGKKRKSGGSWRARVRHSSLYTSGASPPSPFFFFFFSLYLGLLQLFFFFFFSSRAGPSCSRPISRRRKRSAYSSRCNNRADANNRAAASCTAHRPSVPAMKRDRAKMTEPRPPHPSPALLWRLKEDGIFVMNKVVLPSV